MARKLRVQYPGAIYHVMIVAIAAKQYSSLRGAAILYI
jgi:hypothetical protein